MSKMSQLHAELTEQAAELGFNSITEAEENGFHIQYNGSKVWLAYDTDRAYRESYEFLMEEKERIINQLEDVPVKNKEHLKAINEAIKFIKENVK